MTLTEKMQSLASRMTKGPWQWLPFNAELVGFRDQTVLKPVSDDNCSLLIEDADATAISLADLLPRLVMRLHQIVDAYDHGAVEMNSEEIGDPVEEHPPHQWHAEWMHHARALLSEIDKRTGAIDG